MDFYEIYVKTFKTNGNKFEIYPRFKNIESKDLMVRGKDFYAFWDEETGFWSTDEYRLFEIIDRETRAKAQAYFDENPAHMPEVITKYMWDDDSGMVRKWRNYLDRTRDNYKQLDAKITFANTPVKKSDHVSRRLPYSLEPGEYSAWDELIGKIYSPEERQKIEWVIGAIVAGDSKRIQKFLVLYGRPGAGKSTLLRIIEDMFFGYTTTFDAKALAGNGSAFATEAFAENPLIAIQHDGDLSRIYDNSVLNAIVSHDTLLINPKYKKAYPIKPQSFVFMGTNNRVQITGTQSGLIRRLIDVTPTGDRFPEDYFDLLVDRIQFEHGAIAAHCLSVYSKLGRGYYASYRPTKMMRSTNPVYNFVEQYYDELKDPEGITRKRAWDLYKAFCEETNNKLLKQQEFIDELGAFFDEFVAREGNRYGIFRGFRKDRLMDPTMDVDKEDLLIKFEAQASLLDDILADQPAQLANKDGFPRQKWTNIDTTLSDINTAKLHFVKLPEQHIVIDFDLTDEDGNKSFERNLEAASSWAPTYAELSKSGQGIHLHYIYNGDVAQLASAHSPGIEIKTLLGDSSLRRRLTRCNNTPIATLTSGLPMKEKAVHDVKQMANERSVRKLIERNLRKEINPGTKTSIDFIKKILDDAYDSGMVYDVSDLRPRIIAFANNSTNRPLECLKIVQQMKFASEPLQEESEPALDSDRVSFFDVEVYPNLFVVCWKYEDDEHVSRMINPKSTDIEPLLKLLLVGFNNRRYDNHILWAAYMGYDNQRLFELSNRIINSSDRNNAGLFGEAYGLSYADIYDYASKKQGLKKWQIELGLPHRELDIPWDQPVPEERWEDVVEYCVSDVLSTEAVHKARKADFVARQMLAAISGLSVNDTTQKHTARIIFGNDRNPQAQFVYTDLSKEFPGYSYDSGKSTYRGEDPSEGGYVYAEPGLYEEVAVLDVASMHPTSIIQLNLFGPYTSRFADLVEARLAIKAQDYHTARKLLDGKLKQFLDDSEDTAGALAYALKIVINTVYGLTSAKFDNPFRDNRNKDNIVAKRGALFMIDLKHFVQDQGFQVVHIKTDSIKIPHATPEIIEAVHSFGQSYGYTFEHEKTYDKFCLVNDAVYIARDGNSWDAVGAQFQHPYVYKTLFTHEKVDFDDLAETKSVQKGAIYIQYPGSEELHFVGRTGRFVPVVPDGNGGTLYRVMDGRKYAVAGTKGYLWKEAEIVRGLADLWLHIDLSYHQKLVDEAISAIEKFGSFAEFTLGE